MWLTGGSSSHPMSFPPLQWTRSTNHFFFPNWRTSKTRGDEQICFFFFFLLLFGLGHNRRALKIVESLASSSSPSVRLKTRRLWSASRGGRGQGAWVWGDGGVRAAPSPVESTVLLLLCLPRQHRFHQPAILSATQQNKKETVEPRNLAAVISKFGMWKQLIATTEGLQSKGAGGLTLRSHRNWNCSQSGSDKNR